MTMQTQDLITEKMSSGAATSPLDSSSRVPFSGNEARDAEQQCRAGTYSLLAALLRSAPEQALLDHVTDLAAIKQTNDELLFAMSVLGLAAKDVTPEKINDEYHALFIGLGRGELVPYGSWYLTGFLMEKPLAVLREDLAQLGFERNSETHEPEV